MKFRFALLLAALTLVLSVNALANSDGEASTAPAAPALTEAAGGSADPFVPLRSYDGRFTDVKSGDWFAPAVVSAYEYGLLGGRGEKTFSPAGSVTIAEMLTIAARLRAIYTTGSEEVIPAASPGKSWYQPYVDYLKAEQLLDTSFEGSYLLPASRAQMAGIFAFALPSEWYEEPNAALVTTAYASGDFIADVTLKTPYRSEILMMYRRGLLSGMDAAGSFCPDRSVSRAEIAALLTRVIEPEARLTLTWKVLPYHSAKGATLAGLVKAPQGTALPASAKDTALFLRRDRADTGLHLLREDLLRADVQLRFLQVLLLGQGAAHLLLHRPLGRAAGNLPRAGARRRHPRARLPLGERPAELRHDGV